MSFNDSKFLIEKYDDGIFEKLTNEQEEWIADNFNTWITFEYCNNVFGNCLLRMNLSDYKKFKHYLGMEFEEEYIDCLIIENGYVLVSYDGRCNRLTKIMNDIDFDLEK